ncbi:unnamed protein product [Ectocarpus sp. CCAP 1310/34]|nr:unnamed protein product [Ectocarpus sp. CCAP 1310/34]
MGKGGKAAAAAAAAAAATAEETSSRVGPNVVHGVRVTLAYLVLYYFFIVAQGSMKRKLRAYNAAHGKKFDRYFSRDRKMLGWDRTVGNMLEQMGPFLSLFWSNIWLSPYGGLPHAYIAALGWLYVLLRSFYPMLWFAGGGGSEGTSPTIWRVTMPMYVIILVFAVNAAIVIYGA